MAVGKSGTLTVPITKSGGVYVYLYMDWQEHYDSLNNTSYLAITGARGCHTIRNGTWGSSGAISIDGKQVYRWNHGDWYFGGNAGTTNPLVSYNGSVWPGNCGAIPHHADGTKTVTLTVTVTDFSGGSPTWTGDANCKAGVTIPLTAIPRGSDIQCDGGTIGSLVNIRISRHSPQFTHNLSYVFGTAEGVIAEKTAELSIPWTPPLDLCRQIPNAASGIGTLTCSTYNGDSFVESKTCPLNLTVPDTVGLRLLDGWVTAAPDNAGTAAAAIPVYVQGYSKAQVTFDSSKVDLSGAYGAELAEVKLTAEGLSVTQSPYQSGVLHGAGEVLLTVTATDTRGRSVSRELPIFVEAYAKPTMSQIQVFRCFDDGAEHEEGTSVSAQATAHISPLAGHNTVTLTASYGSVGGSLTGDTVLSSGVAAVLWPGLVSAQQTYWFRLALRDALGNEAVYTTPIPTAQVFFHGRDGGKGAAFGKYAERDGLLEVDWDVQVNGDLTIGGRSLLDWLYPVGSIYSSTAAASPAELFGGTWERLKDRFLLGAGDTYPAGSTGGEAAHSLTAEENGQHTHPVGIGSGSGRYLYWGDNEANQNKDFWGYGYSDDPPSNKLFAQPSGGGQPHNNLPPYLTVYMWQRVA